MTSLHTGHPTLLTITLTGDLDYTFTLHSGTSRGVRCPRTRLHINIWRFEFCVLCSDLATGSHFLPNGHIAIQNYCRPCQYTKVNWKIVERNSNKTKDIGNLWHPFGYSSSEITIYFHLMDVTGFYFLINPALTEGILSLWKYLKTHLTLMKNSWLCLSCGGG